MYYYPQAEIHREDPRAHQPHLSPPAAADMSFSVSVVEYSIYIHTSSLLDNGVFCAFDDIHSLNGIDDPYRLSNVV